MTGGDDGLRWYQRDAIRGVYDAFRAGARSVMLQLPTGAGKSHAAIGGLIVPSVRAGNLVAFAADTSELVDDAAKRLRDAGLRAGIIQADRPRDPDAEVFVCSLQTLVARRVEELPAFTRIVVDEAHIAGAPTIRALLERWPAARVVGLSATPHREDGQRLPFDVLVAGVQPRVLIAEGSLVQPVVYSPAEELPPGTVRADPVEVVLSRHRDRRCVIFAPNGAEATRIERALCEAGHATLAVLDTMPRVERARVRDRLAAGEIRSLVTVRALAKGFDAPLLDVAIVTTGCSLVTWLQACGRVMRPFPGKREAIIEDLAGAAWRHGCPDDDRTWAFNGAQGKPALEPTLSLSRCRKCEAVFAAGPSRCPRCGGEMVPHARALKVKRVDAIIASGMPAAEREKRWRAAIAGKLLNAGKPAWLAEKVAREAKWSGGGAS